MLLQNHSISQPLAAKLYLSALLCGQRQMEEGIDTQHITLAVGDLSGILSNHINGTVVLSVFGTRF